MPDSERWRRLVVGMALMAELKGFLINTGGPERRIFQIDKWLDDYLAGRASRKDPKRWRGHISGTLAHRAEQIARGGRRHFGILRKSHGAHRLSQVQLIPEAEDLDRRLAAWLADCAADRGWVGPPWLIEDPAPHPAVLP